MRADGLAGETVTLWRPAGQLELDLVAASGWRAWPPRLAGQPVFSAVLGRQHAARITRARDVPDGGAGYVARFEVRRAYLDRYDARQTGGREVGGYRIPAADLAELNANIAGVIVEEAQYRGPVADQEFSDAARVVGHPLPSAWRGYLQGRSWFCRGWLPGSGRFVSLMTPREALSAASDWPSASAFAGLVLLGDNGAREFLAVDARRDPAPVVMIDITSARWQDALPQVIDVAQFTRRVEAGTFTLNFTRRLPG